MNITPRSRPLRRFALTAALLSITCATSARAQEVILPYSSGIQLKGEDMSTAALNKAQASGMKYVRKGIEWHTIETSEGVYNWTQVDAWVANMEARGFSMLLCIVWNNSIYDTAYPRAITTENGREGYAKFAERLAARYQGKDIIWELWNEPNLQGFWRNTPEQLSNTDAMAEEYAALVNFAVPRMKAADPNCRVAAGSISALWSPSFSWFERCIEMGMLNSGIDMVSVHPYGFVWPELAMATGYPGIRQRLDANGRPDMPIINSEVGYDEQWIIDRGVPAAQAREVQAWMCVRQNLVDAMSDIGVSIWYEMSSSTWGVVNTDLSDRPTFTAMQVMAEEMEGYRFRERIELPSTLDWAAVFENDDGDLKMVVWTTANPQAPYGTQIEVPHAIALPIGAAGSYVVTDVFGNTSTLSTSDDHLDITITGGPKYIPLTEDPAATYRNVALRRPATVSTGTGADKMTDGIINTDNSRWLANTGFPQWVEVDLGRNHLIDNVIFRQHTERTNAYQVQIWNGTDWSPVASAPSNSAMNIVVTLQPPVETSRVRFHVTSGDSYLKVYELEVYGSAMPLEPPPVYANLALGQPATISSGSGAAYLTDGALNDSSRWLAATGFPQTMEVDLGGTYPVDKVIVRQHTERIDNYQVQTWNGSTWTTAVSGTGNTAMNLEATFAAVQASKVRFVATSGQYNLKIFEFEVYGYESGGGDAQVPTVPTGLSATAVSNSQINLSWTASTDNVGVTGYKVFRGGVEVATVSGTTYSNTGLSAATSYTYAVAAVDAAANVSAQSGFASATTQGSLQNVALGRPVTVSSGTGGSYLTDGLSTDNSRWLADYGFPQWAEVDLGSARTVSQVTFAQHTERTNSYEVQVWNGSAWSTVASASSNSVMTIAVNFTPVSTSRVRFVVTTGDVYLKVYELGVQGN